MKEDDVVRLSGKRTSIEVRRVVADAIGRGRVTRDAQGGHRGIEGIDALAEAVRNQIALEETRTAADAERALKVASLQPRLKPIDWPFRLSAADQLVDVQSDREERHPLAVLPLHNLAIPEVGHGSRAASDFLIRLHIVERPSQSGILMIGDRSLSICRCRGSRRG